MKSIKQINGYLTSYVNDNNRFHRLKNPAIEFSKSVKSYYLNGKRNRLDGPAIVRSDGYKEYYINGNNILSKRKSKLIKLNDLLK